MIQMYPKYFALAKNATEVLEVFSSGRIACVIGVEGLHQIGNNNVLDSLKLNDGIIMICFLRELVSPINGGEPSLQDVIDHIIYAGERIGYDHVGIGSDFDGMLKGPDGLDEVSDYPQLVAGLVSRGVSLDNIKTVIGLNILRVMEKVDSVSRTMMLNKSHLPECDAVASSWTDEERGMMYQEGLRRSRR
ncbi:hypothetical protein COL940_003496 [Colletotrichum noveboracense]|nr:hypothetical protein COL940_003496 [Colletotrichum noveboracense]